MKSKPYAIQAASTFYVSGDYEEGPYEAAKKVLKAARRADDSPTQVTVVVQYIPGDAGEPSYWSATATVSS